jgi:uncharacterized protein YjbI with pentapeptide repeats
MSAEAGATLRLDAIKTALTVAAGVGALVTLIVALRRQSLSERGQRHTEEDAREQRITTLYVAAAEQVGSEKAAVRLAGLYALERLGQDNPKLRQTVIDVICAYLRMPYTPPAEVLRRDAKHSPQALASDDPDPEPEQQPQRHQELQVRLTAQRLIRDHAKAPRPDPEPATYWQGEHGERMNLDLTGAVLVSFDLADCRLETATFSSAQFHQGTHLDGVNFHGNADLNGVQFHGDGNLIEAHFHGNAELNVVQFHGDAVLFRAQFHRNAGLGGVQFYGHAGLGGTRFYGSADLGGACFHGSANLRGVQFHQGADMSDMQFHGSPDLSESQFHAYARLVETQFFGNADLERIQFHGGADLRGVQFHGNVGLGGARFYRDAKLAEAQFHGNADLSGVQFHGSLDLGKAQFHGPFRLTDAQATETATLPCGWTLTQQTGDQLGRVVRTPTIADAGSSRPATAT